MTSKTLLWFGAVVKQEIDSLQNIGNVEDNKGVRPEPNHK